MVGGVSETVSQPGIRTPPAHRRRTRLCGKAGPNYHPLVDLRSGPASPIFIVMWAEKAAQEFLNHIRRNT
jgi:hypothetical protein